MAENQEASQTKKSRPRAKNFDSKENELILDLFAEHDAVLRSKHNSAVTCQRKQMVLKEICDRVNSLGVANRTVQQIKNKWTNIVGDGREKQSEMNKSAGKNWGWTTMFPSICTTRKSDESLL